MSTEPSTRRRPTMADVARAAGVSLSTVDRVLNQRASVRADTAKAIAEAAAALGLHTGAVIAQRLVDHRPVVRLGFLLQESSEVFYSDLARALSIAAAQCATAKVRVNISYLDDLDPHAVAQRIRALGAEVDGIGVVAPDHPEVRAAIAHLRKQQVPVLALVSELGAGLDAGYVGVDNRRMGRTAGWFVSQLAPAPGPVAVMLSSQRFQCQELCELSFISYLNEHSSDWEWLASRLTLEDESFAYGNTLDLLSGHPDLAALYVAGGGIKGVLRALAQLQARQVPLPVVICHDLTPVTQAALRDGRLQAVLSHPVAAMAERAVQLLAKAAGEPVHTGTQRAVLPLIVDVRETV